MFIYGDVKILTKSLETKEKIRQAHLGHKKNWTEEGLASLRKYRYEHGTPFKGKHHTEETKHKLSISKIGKPQGGKPVIVLNKDFCVVTRLRSRQMAVDEYANTITHSHIRKCLETNAKINNIDMVLFYDDIAFIYEKDYNSLISLSTIETVSSEMADESNGVE